ncbi:hypothetical protein AB0A05_27160 [Streptomyces sp. NPDC046374]|uniref:hypothetical protein n=1 Tax=Streptomyces sp. NPDC046374 TaxID=3154917 RepID=UPI0033F618C5
MIPIASAATFVAALFCLYAHVRFARAARAYTRAISTWNGAMTAAKDAGVAHDDIPHINDSEEVAAASRAFSDAEPLCHLSRTIIGAVGLGLVLLVVVVDTF